MNVVEQILKKELNHPPRIPFLNNKKDCPHLVEQSFLLL